MRKVFLLLAVLSPLLALAQKKPLDHSVYDGWQSISEKMISPNGRFVVYTVIPQEGDGSLFIQATDNSWKQEIPRGYGGIITEDNRAVVCRIRAPFAQTREARIKKKKPEDMPKDSLAIFDLASGSLRKIPRVKSFKTPEKSGGWLAYLLEKPLAEPSHQPDSLGRLNKLDRMADSLHHLADSLRQLAQAARIQGLGVLQPPKPGSRGTRPAEESVEEGTELVLINLQSGQERSFPLAVDYYFSKKGNSFLLQQTRRNSDSSSRACLLLVNTQTGKTDTLMKGFHEIRNPAFDEPGRQLCFTAERDSSAKALRKFYSLWYYRIGMDSAMLQVHPKSPGVPPSMTPSPDFANHFSKDGKRIFLGLAPVRPPRDTTLVDFETARLDIWHYQDDYLQPQQLVELNREIKRSYLAVSRPGSGEVLPLADDSCETVTLSAEGNGEFALGESSRGFRIQQQWEQAGQEKIFLVNTESGSRKLVSSGIRGGAQISPEGKFIYWYDWKQRAWFSYQTSTGALVNLTRKIPFPLYDELDDHPDDPPSHGSMSWQQDDQYLYLYDRYDIWKCDPTGQQTPVNFTLGQGRKSNLTFRYQPLDREERFIKNGQRLYFTVFDQLSKKSGLALDRGTQAAAPEILTLQPALFRNLARARESERLLFTRESFDQSPDLYTAAVDSFRLQRLSAINPQQQQYNWLTVELLHYKMLDGRPSEGLLYKPENFDSTQKYPVIFYFYERDADTRYNYNYPQPVRASINIPYFVSNGYLVFDPDIYYKSGQPGADAYNSVMAAARLLSHFKWVDSTRMGLQGHSWGGYQVAYLVTRTSLFAAAEAGAPVANMTSAYGGIRWGTGISRQFQYEKSQSRIGPNLWQRPDLYIRNSPLFQADKVTTPLLMMHNDADGAVPWYQGIEYFTALRRLGKKVWLMQYNGEDHGLLERRNRKDWSIRLGQFFDYFLKGSAPAKWITSGVPALSKGIDWGLSVP